MTILYGRHRQRKHYSHAIVGPFRIDLPVTCPLSSGVYRQDRCAVRLKERRSAAEGAIAFSAKETDLSECQKRSKKRSHLYLVEVILNAASGFSSIVHARQRNSRLHYIRLGGSCCLATSIVTFIS